MIVGWPEGIVLVAMSAKCGVLTYREVAKGADWSDRVAPVIVLLASLGLLYWGGFFD